MAEEKEVELEIEIKKNDVTKETDRLKTYNDKLLSTSKDKAEN